MMFFLWFLIMPLSARIIITDGSQLSSQQVTPMLKQHTVLLRGSGALVVRNGGMSDIDLVRSTPEQNMVLLTEQVELLQGAVDELSGNISTSNLIEGGSTALSEEVITLLQNEIAAQKDDIETLRTTLAGQIEHDDEDGYSTAESRLAKLEGESNNLRRHLTRIEKQLKRLLNLLPQPKSHDDRDAEYDSSDYDPFRDFPQ